MKVFIAEFSGFCYGVKRAVDIVRDLIKSRKGPIHILGNLIHNPTVVEELSKAGVIKVASVSEAKSGILVIRSHGATKQILDEARERKLTITDTTCPNVKNAQVIAQDLIERDFQVVIVGDKGHAEVEGILSYTLDRAIVVDGVESLKKFDKDLEGKIGVVCQTTIHLSDLKQVVEYLLGRTRELVVHNTICDVTTRRQAATLELAKHVDAMIIVGGKESANTARLAEISSQTGVKTYQVETEFDMKPDWFQKDMVVGLSAGASTPSDITLSVQKRLVAWEEEGIIA